LQIVLRRESSAPAQGRQCTGENSDGAAASDFHAQAPEEFGSEF
jgi:hypothetical protein